MGYEYLLTGLPDLQAGMPSPITLDALNEQFDEQLHDADRPLLEQLRMTIDSPEIQEKAALYDADDTLDTDKPVWWDDARALLSDMDVRATLLYEQGLKSKNAFIREWYGFNQDMNNVMVAAICRKHGFEVKKMIVGNNEVAETLRAHTTQKDFGLNEVMDNYQPILALATIDNLMEREKQMDALRFEWLQDRTMFDVFSVEQVLAYYLKVNMLLRWSQLTVEEGEQVFRSMVADMKKGIQLQ